METRAATSLRARAEPSWPRVLVTTLQLWLRRRRRIGWALLGAVLRPPAGPGRVADGGAAYLSERRADVAARASVGGELLHNPAVQADPPARQQLSAGGVDPRLIATIGILAALHPVHLVSFGDLSPGASPGVPLRSAVLYGVTHGVTAGNASLGSLRALLLAQRPPYRPAGIGAVRLAGGRSAFPPWSPSPRPPRAPHRVPPLV